MALNVGRVVGSSEHQILLLSKVHQLFPENVSFCSDDIVTLTPQSNVLDRIVSQMGEDHFASATLYGGVGSDELSPGLLHERGPDLTLHLRASIDGPGPTCVNDHRDIVVDSDEGVLAIDVEPDGVSSSFVDRVSDEVLFDRTRPRVELNHSGDEVAVSECALSD